MRIVVISDTHIPASCDKLPDKLIAELRKTDMIIHAGDLTESYILDELNGIASTEAVAGNMDSFDIKKFLPVKKVLDIDGFKIGIIHGNGPPDKMLEYVQGEFKDEKLDCVIYGHSHTPRIDKVNNTLYFNPGSPTERIFAPYNSFGILETGKELKAEIIKL